MIYLSLERKKDYILNSRIANGTYGGVRGEKFIKNYPLLNYAIF